MLCPITPQLAPAHQGNDADLVRRLAIHIRTCPACTAEAQRIVAAAKCSEEGGTIARVALAGLGVAGLLVIRGITNVLDRRMDH